MASTLSHLRQWKHNRDFLSTIAFPYTDWIVTVAFYTALHAVDALLAAEGVKRVTDHRSRNGVLMDTNRYQKIWKLFSPLYNLSQTVRYLANPADWVPYSCISRDILGRYLYPIEDSVKGLLMVRKAIQDSDMPNSPIQIPSPVV